MERVTQWHYFTLKIEEICALRMLKLVIAVDEMLPRMVTGVSPLLPSQTVTIIVSTVTTVCTAPLCDGQCYLQHGLLAIFNKSCSKSVYVDAHLIIKQPVV